MPFWSAVFFGFVFAHMLWFVITTVLFIFKLNISSLIRSISMPILWVTITVFFLFASEKILTVFFVTDVTLVFLSIFAHKIIEWIEKSKQE